MFQHLSGYTADEIIGKNYRDLSCPEGDKHTVIEAINDQMKTGKVGVLANLGVVENINSSIACFFMYMQGNKLVACFLGCI